MQRLKCGLADSLAQKFRNNVENICYMHFSTLLCFFVFKNLGHGVQGLVWHLAEYFFLFLYHIFVCISGHKLKKAS